MLINALFLLAVIYCGVEVAFVAMIFKTKKFSYWFATIHNSVFWTVFSLRFLVLFADFKFLDQFELQMPEGITKFLSALSAEKLNTEFLFLFSLYVLVIVGAIIRVMIGYRTIKLSNVVATGMLLSMVVNSNPAQDANIYATLFMTASILWISAVITNKIVISHMKNKNTKTNLDLIKDSLQNKGGAQSNV